jgi:hypothetical protein
VEIVQSNAFCKLSTQFFLRVGIFRRRPSYTQGCKSCQQTDIPVPVRAEAVSRAISDMRALPANVAKAPISHSFHLLNDTPNYDYIREK